MFERAINHYASTPKSLFVIDGLGALLSAFLLGFVLVELEMFFGIPKMTLYALAFLPCVFAVYDLYCFRRIDQNIGYHLKIIAIVNLLYCVLSLGLAMYHFQKLTYLGWGYIIMEILIVISIAMLEWKTAIRLQGE